MRIRKALENLYSAFLPKGTHPFIYIAIDIDPASVDVNVHPTKREVNILNEEEIIAVLCTSIAKRLAETDHSRVFLAQTLLPNAPLDAGISSEKIRRSINMNGPQNPSTFVRTDSKQQKIVSMLDPSFSGHKNLDLNTASAESLTSKPRVSINLASIKELRAQVRDSLHEDLTAIFTEHVFVGLVDLDRRLAAIQHLTKLYIVDYGAVSAELFYQIGLSEFGNLGSIDLRPPVKLRDLLTVAIEAHQAKQPLELRDDATKRNEHINSVYDRLFGRRDMLREYFALDISDTGDLTSVPLLMRDYKPALSKLPNFVLRLGPNVDWDTEMGCFSSFLRELALFYVPEMLNTPSTRRSKKSAKTDHEPSSSDSTEMSQKETELRSTIENVLFPAFKKRLIATVNLANEKRVCQVANLPDLYKTFERC